MSYQKLTDEHARIDVALARLRNVLDSDERSAGAAAKALVHLADELRSHLAHEDSTLYHQLIIAKKPAYAHAVEQFSEQFNLLREDWDTYLDAWSAATIAADWHGFDAATRSMIDRMAERVAAENELLYTAALQSGAIQLREPPTQSAA